MALCQGIRSSIGGSLCHGSTTGPCRRCPAEGCSSFSCMPRLHDQGAGRFEAQVCSRGVGSSSSAAGWGGEAALGPQHVGLRAASVFGVVEGTGRWQRWWHRGLPGVQPALCFQGEQLLKERPGQSSAILHGQVAETMHAGLPRLEDVQLETELRRESTVRPLQSEFDILMAHYVPVYVMLPLETVKRDNVLSYPELLLCNLRALKAAGVDGAMVDVWWGIVEAEGPKQYNWSAYKALFKQIQSVGLKVQVVMSFHQCGGNTGDSCYIPLPPWILEAGEECPDIFFTNQDKARNQEYLSFGIDEEPVLKGRTGVQVYYDFMKSFRDNMQEFLDAGLVTEIEVGLGPAGELRFPSYPETHGWRFPGIGEFQCYDKFLLAQLRHEANSLGKLEWGYWGPHDAGRYNDWPDYTGFFGHHGSFTSDYGRFFLEWYSTVLLKHGDRILEAAADVFAGCKTKLAAKVAGVHWWYNSKNHAAELAAGYYNLRERDGYRPIAKMLARHNATLNFTCVEMRNDEQYWEARCGPEGLVQQVLNAGWQEGLEVACENALPRYDWAAFDQVVANARPDGINPDGPPKRRISVFTFLRLGPDLLQERNWSEFVHFVRAMHAGMDYHPEPEQFWKPRSRVRHSKPVQALPPDEMPTPVASVPLNVAAMPLAPAPESEPFFSPDAPGGGLGVQVGEIPFGRASVAGSSFSSSSLTETLSGALGPEAGGNAPVGFEDERGSPVKASVIDARGNGGAGSLEKEAAEASMASMEGLEQAQGKWGRQGAGSPGLGSSDSGTEGRVGSVDVGQGSLLDDQWREPVQEGRTSEDTSYRETSGCSRDGAVGEEALGGEGSLEQSTQTTGGGSTVEGGGGLIATLVNLFSNSPQ